MAENPREDILAIAQFPYLIFGNGYIAMIVGGVEKEDREGRTIVELQIIPEELMRKRYGIAREQLNINGVMPFTVLRKDLIPLNLFDKAKERWLYLKTFDGKETEIGSPSKFLRARLDELEKYSWMLEGDNIFLSELANNLRTNPGEVLAQNSEVLSKVMEPTLDLLNAKKGREVGE